MLRELLMPLLEYICWLFEPDSKLEGMIVPSGMSCTVERLMACNLLFCFGPYVEAYPFPLKLRALVGETHAFKTFKIDATSLLHAL